MRARYAEVDGGYFGGYVKPANLKENRRDRRLARNQNGKRQGVVIVRERDGNGVPGSVQGESLAARLIKARVTQGTKLKADEAGSGIALREHFEVARINHEEAYTLDGACTNRAESFFSRLRRSEIGHHHHVAVPTCFATRRQALGAKITAASATANKSNALLVLPLPASLRWISAVTGSGTLRFDSGPARFGYVRLLPVLKYQIFDVVEPVSN